MTGMLRVPRSRGALSGMLLVLLGIWGGLIPFVGPYLHYAYPPARAWTFTTGRFWLELLPAIGAVAGGLVLIASRLRPAALFGAWLAALSGCWFAIGSVLAPLWNGSLSAGQPAGGPVARAVEQIGFFTGLGVVIAMVAALALGRLSVLAIRDVKIAERAAAAAAAPAAARPAPARTGPARTGAAATTAAAAQDTLPTRKPPARTVLTRVFPAKADRSSVPGPDQPTSSGRRPGRPSAPDPVAGGGTREEVSSGTQRQ
ncbi:MAG TPA: hypothetical protein VN840_03475 [Streptosporangiaceae bacterium]|nr:hypothetical protein [Streptosporangiaceae bacterium]